MTPRKKSPVRRRGGRALSFAMALACLAAIALALAFPEALADPERPGPRPGPRPAPSGAPAASAAASAHASGLFPVAGDAEVPLRWMPPGTSASPLPSDEIFPPQTLTIRFNHKLHVKQLGQTCKACHGAAYKSGAAKDRLLPDPAQTCDGCHDVDHSDRKNVEAGTDESGQCGFCHLGEGAGKGGQVAPLVLPRPNLRFPHDRHLARNIGCAQCHGKVEELELATRAQLPRMAGCFTCHDMPGPAAGGAKSACSTCHLMDRRGKLVQSFASGKLVPPRWLHQAGHTADWIVRHKSVAANDSAFCGTCHTAEYCTACHDGRVRPRRVHPNDWLSMHPEAARQDNPRCTSCHQLQTFCADCHRRVGVARDAPSGNRLAGRRFHPPPAEFTTAPRGPRHHAWEAQRNLNACVSCHTERDCATCHATKGISGGQGVNPHPLGFRAQCGAAFRRNPRPCLVCHQATDRQIRSCQ